MDENEKICFDCASYLPASLGEATEYGICLLDEAFDPVADDLLEGRMDDRCRALVERKKFVGERPAWPRPASSTRRSWCSSSSPSSSMP